MLLKYGSPINSTNHQWGISETPLMEVSLYSNDKKC